MQIKKTTISAEIIADSKNEFGQRLISYVLTFPRIILAELNTHRMFSRNSASSRAIPFKKMLERVQNDPFIPMAWQKDHSGMQGTEYLTGSLTEYNWLKARDKAVEYASILNSLDVTKQICNRLLEPFLWHTAIVTATEYENFFALRCPQYKIDSETFRSKKDALPYIHEVLGESDFDDTDDYLQWASVNKGQGEIHIMALAEAMWDAMNESTPKELTAGEWHIPFGDKMEVPRLIELAHQQVTKHKPEHAPDFHELNPIVQELAIKVATARCARVSYMNFDGSDDYEKDIALYDRLSGSGRPFEHCAKAMTVAEFQYWTRQHGTGLLGVERGGSHQNQGWCGNFRGFIQLRKTFANENRTVDNG